METVLVTPEQILSARDRRAHRQSELLSTFHCSVISYTMNIAGPVKTNASIHRAFQEGADRLDCALAAANFPVLFRELRQFHTGDEGIWVVNAPGRSVKELCIGLENSDPLGRLFDMDVIDEDHGLWSRTALGFAPRSCLVCGQQGKACSSQQLHTLLELRQTTQKIIRDFFARKDADHISSQAVRALLYEVCTTPKPGLVDRANSGSHSDMDIFTFIDSTAALIPYFRQATAIGQCSSGCKPEEYSFSLRKIGLRAEQAMFLATGGVNTHKGIIFSMGILCAAMGQLWKPAGYCRDVSKILEQSANLSKKILKIGVNGAQKIGGANYLPRGIRREMADGLPCVTSGGLPALHTAIASGSTIEEAGISALLTLMTLSDDTNLLSRGGDSGQRWAIRRAGQLVEKLPVSDLAKVRAFDRSMIRRNLSPGGSADLLAITYFLHFVCG